MRVEPVTSGHRPAPALQTGWAPALLLALCWALAPAGAARAAVEFPGPRSFGLSQPGAAVLATRPAGQAADDLLVGMAGGALALFDYSPPSRTFLARQQLFFEGRVTHLQPWEGLPLAQRGVVVATADPDRVSFVTIAAQYPYLAVVATLNLDEDPGGTAWFGDVAGGHGLLAVSLPGLDAVAVVAADGGWHLREVLGVGDGPGGLAGCDLDGDGRRELAIAQHGPLAGNLSVVTVGGDGGLARRTVFVPGVTVGQVASFDQGAVGRSELVVTDRLAPRATFLSLAGPELQVTGSLDLTVPASQLVTWTLAGGEPALMAADPGRGASEFASLTAGGWVRRGTYFPGCRPLATAPADVDGDGQADIATVGDGVNAGAGVLTLMEARPGPGFWGLPSLGLTALPGDVALADFDGDGRGDVLVAAALEPTLSLFAGRADGSLEPTPVTSQLAYTPGRLAVVEADADASPELAVLDVSAGQVVILDRAAGQFTEAQRLDLGQYPSFITAGDLDRDGRSDLLALTSDPLQVHLLFGQAAGGFAAPVALAGEIGTVRAALVDLDGDERLDIVGVDGSSRLWWRLNSGGRSFTEPLWLHAGNGASLLATGDRDGDHDVDVIVGCRVDRSLVAYENTGGTLVRRAGSQVLDSEPTGLRMGDLDGDAKDDIVVVLRDQDKFDAYLGLPAWNQEFALGVPGTPDILEMAVADVNGDGSLDLLSLDGALQLGVAHLNLDPDSVALEPRALVVECDRDGGLDATVRPGFAGAWRLEARLGTGWRLLADAGGAAAGSLEPGLEAWRLRVPAGALADWGRPTALRLVVESGDGPAEMRVVAVPAACLDAGGRDSGRPAWVAAPWPNPGNPVIAARFRLARPGWARVAVHDLAGRRVATLIEGVLAAGEHDIRWDGRRGALPAAAGTYLLRVETGTGELTGKLVLLK